MPQTAAGSLVLVVGPSGAGKDTLIEAARAQLRDDPRFAFPMRIITRPTDPHERHVEVSEAEFDRLHAEGAFLLAWSAHGNRYGVPGGAATALEGGQTVVVNVSRTVIEEACMRCSRVRVVNVTAGATILRQRLMARAREDGTAIDRRVARAESAVLPDSVSVDTIDNGGPLTLSIARFSALLDGYAGKANRETTRKRSPAAG
jgi:ribose 1,5-bisphosphokinase